MFVCMNCNHRDQRPGLVYCPRCGSQLFNLLPPITQSPDSLAPVSPVTPVSRLSLVRQGSEQKRVITPHSMNRDLYQTEEELMEGDPVWKWLGKHLAAYQTRERAKESLNDLAELQKEALIRVRQQIVDAEVARRQAEYEDAIQQEQLTRRRKMMADYLYELNQEFSDNRYANVPEEIKADIINSLFRQAEEMVFKGLKPIVIGRRLNQGNKDDNVIIIDVDGD